MISLRIINKVARGQTMMQEMRVFVVRTDGSLDRIGTVSASRAHIKMLRNILHAGAAALSLRCDITEPLGSMPGRG